MMSRYYKILGVSPNASEAEIKKAYRKKARLFHPDVSEQPNAEEKFVEVNEAYEYLLKRKAGKVYSETRHSYQKTQQRQKTYAEWKAKDSEKARARARHHAKMKYQTFKNTNYYKNEIALEIIGDNFMFYSLIAACIIPPFLGLARGSYAGFYFTLVIGFAGLQVWSNALKKESNIRLSLLFSSIVRILKTKVFILFTMIGINLVIFLKIVMHTMVPLEITFSLLIASVIMGYQVARLHPGITKNPYNRTLYGFVIAPFVYQFFFVVNFFISGNPHTETYRYKLVMTKTYSKRSNKPRYDEAPILQLKDGKYDDYLGIRLLWSPEKMRLNNTIDYNFEEGILGMKVLKSYELY